MTPSYEELVASNEAIRAAMAEGPEGVLRAIPGVLHVSVGLKETAGEATAQLCARVYVAKKRPLAELSPAERIPAEVGGVVTDVNTLGVYAFSSDLARYRPLKGGISISNRIIDFDESMTHTQISRGTLGFTGTYTPDGSPVLLSNWHVLMANAARIGDPVFQPAPSTIPPGVVAPQPPMDNTDAVAKIVKSAVTDKIDGAIARIDISTWCRCCGIDYRDEINGLSIGGHPPSNSVVGVRTAVAGMQVYKVGMHTGRTAGAVVDAAFNPPPIPRLGSTYTFHGQIRITNSDTTTRFSEHGDSGSLIVDGDGYAVGLLFASSSDPPPNDSTIANHIADVCSELTIALNTRSATRPSAGSPMTIPVWAPTEAEGAELYRRTREKLVASASGARVLELAERHREEVVRLVTSRRPVTLAWHRLRGPAFLAMALETLRAGGDDLPSPVGGVSVADMLDRMATVLAYHAGPDLRDLISAERDVVVDAVRASAMLSQLLDALDTTR